ncbi:MAG: hypothetical protein JW821_13405 [Deltaproteobacteria bacterium]|nr:hypothetical protein [Deltaproteobacteria bacterium]
MSKTCHILVENHEAYQYIKGSGRALSDRVWHTASPWLIEKLSMDEETVFSLESLITLAQMNRLGGFCLEASRRIRDHLDALCRDWPAGIPVGYALFPSVWRTLFVLMYKAFLVGRWINEVRERGHYGLIVGGEALSPVHGFHVNVGRFDTVYTALASRFALPETVEFIKRNKGGEDDKIRKMKLLGQSSQERIFSLLNLDLSLFLFKLWKILLHSREISLPFAQRSTKVLFYKSCELIDESFYHFLRYGGRIRRFTQNGSSPASLDIVPEALDKDHVNRIFEECRVHAIPDWNDRDDAFRVVSDILCNRINTSLRFGLQWARGLQRQLDEPFTGEQGLKTQRIGSPALLITNSLTTPTERALYFLLKERKIPVFAYEHSVTFGLSEMSRDFVEDQSSLLTSDAAIFYNAASQRMHSRASGYKGGTVAGAPLLNRRLRFRKLQRYLSRRLIKVPAGKRLVVYVANLYSNNHLYNPGLPTDYRYHLLKKAVVYDVLGKTEDPCLLKLYPTHRYREDDPFLDLMVLPPNVKAIQYFEYRYLRAVGDVVICDSPQSTLGWVWSAGVPLIYLDLPSNHLLPDVAKAFSDAIFRVDCSKPAWVDDVKSLLDMPHGELLQRWNHKRPAREAAEAEYLFGPPGNAGKRAAKFAIEETLRRQHHMN